MDVYAQLLLLGIAIFGFWFIILRPARAQQRKLAAFQDSLKVGDEVIITAGIFGTLRSVDGARVEIEISPGTVITVARQVVVRRADDLPDAGTTTSTERSADEPDHAGPDAATEEK